jgi:hypothetical protein
VIQEDKEMKVKGHPDEVNMKVHQVMKVINHQEKVSTNIHQMMINTQNIHIIHIMKNQNINQIDGKVEPNKQILFAHH